MLRAQHFTDVQRVDRVVPLGTWPKDHSLKRLGAFFRLQFLDMALEAYTLALFTRNDWTEAETQVLLAKVRKEVKTNTMHIYTHWYFILFANAEFYPSLYVILRGGGFANRVLVHMLLLQSQ